MSVTPALTLASLAREHVAERLGAYGIDAVLDAGTFYPEPGRVLVGLPSLTARTLAGATYTVPVYVVSRDPLNDTLAVDRLYTTADTAADALDVAVYDERPWAGGTNQDPLPALWLTATVSLNYQPASEV